MSSEPNLITQVIEVGLGSTAALKCHSIDENHNFMFWQSGENKIIGPGNYYDPTKYKYEVLSGKLLVKNVMQNEEGYYRCVSKNLNTDSLNIGTVQMLVKNRHSFAEVEDNSDIEIAKIIIGIVSLIIIIACAIFIHKLRKEEKRLKSRITLYADDDDEASGDEIYNKTTTTINNSEPAPGPSKPTKQNVTGIDNQALDTDFNSAFEQIAINIGSRDLV